MTLVFTQEEWLACIRTLMHDILELFKAQPYAHEVKFEHLGYIYTLSWPEYAEVVMMVDKLE